MPVYRYSSRVFAAIEATYDRMASQSFPSHAKLPARSPGVYLFGFRGDSTAPKSEAERINVITPDTDGDTVWARLGPAGRDETILINVVVYTEVPGVKNPLDVLRRLDELVHVVEAGVYDFDANATRPLGFDGEVDATRVSRTSPDLYAFNDAGEIGGMCEVAFNVRANI